MVCLCGDLGDFGLRTSKTNSYLATLSPAEQMDYIYELFYPIKDKIVACVPGNHEERLVREVGICPMLSLCSKWGCEDVYRENLAIVKLTFGKRTGKQPVSFIGIVTHGSTRNKHRKMTMCVEGADWGISGHTHQPEYSPRGKIRINARYPIATHIPYKEIVVDANLSVGGYSLKKEYEIPAPPELQYLELGVKRDNSRNTNAVNKTIDYHAITI